MAVGQVYGLAVGICQCFAWEAWAWELEGALMELKKIDLLNFSLNLRVSLVKEVVIICLLRT